MPQSLDTIALIRERHFFLKHRMRHANLDDDLKTRRAKKRPSFQTSRKIPEKRSYEDRTVSKIIIGDGRHKYERKKESRPRYTRRVSLNPEELYKLQDEHPRILGKYEVVRCPCKSYFFSRNRKSNHYCPICSDGQGRIREGENTKISRLSELPIDIKEIVFYEPSFDPDGFLRR